MSDEVAINSASLREVIEYLKQVNDELTKVDNHNLDFQGTNAHDRLCQVLAEANPVKCSGPLFTYFSNGVGIKAKLNCAVKRLESIVG